MRLFREIQIDRLRPGIWLVRWERRDTDGSVETVAIAGSTYAVAKAVPVLLGLAPVKSTAERAERIRRLAREMGWQEPDITIENPEDPR